MNDNETRFFIVRAPTEPFLLLSARRSQWAFTQQALDRLAVFENNTNNPVLVLVSLGQGLYGVFKLDNK